MEKKVLNLQEIVKDFPGVRALDGVSFDLEKGEVHVLLGENGAGKSTLMKILAGVYQPQSGRILLKEEEVHFLNPSQALERHISIIYQEFNLIPSLSVAQNIFLGREPVRKNGLIDRKKLHDEAQRILEFLNVSIPVQAQVSELSIAQQQLVEVAKALSVNAEILIMDEPTSTLSESEIDGLFNIIHNLQSQGVSIIYISHRLQEIKKIGTRVTVIRDGKTIGTRSAQDTDLDELISMMVGRKISKERLRGKNTGREQDALRVSNLCQNKKLKNISMYVKRGEIVGIAGLVGAGRTELANAIYGITPIDKGEVEIFGKKIKSPSPAQSIANHVGFIPENRKEDGLAIEMSIVHNVVQASMKLLFKWGYIYKKIEYAVAKKLCAELKVNTGDMDRIVQNLSGGNQQKVVLSKWLCTQSELLIFDEPTRGIDVGAKEEIHQLMVKLAESGKGIIMISSDLPEILTLSDRIYIMREGEIVAELPGEGTTQEEVIGYAAGRKKIG